MKKPCFMFVYLLILLGQYCFADTVKLKNGRVVSGTLKEINETNVVLDVKLGSSFGTVWFSKDEVESINELDIKETEAKLFPSQIIISDNKQAARIASADGELADGEQFHDFKLGQHEIGENSITFEFPDPNSDTLYLFNLKDWKPPRGKNKLVVSLYDKDHYLLEWRESACSATPFFGSIALSKISRETVKDVAYFSISVEKCSTALVQMELNEENPEVKFARKVEAAIKESKESYFNLLLNKPDSEQKKQGELFLFQLLQAMLIKGGKTTSVKPMDKKEAEEFKPICPEPFLMELGWSGSNETDGSTETMAMTCPIGKVNNEWKILNSYD